MSRAKGRTGQQRQPRAEEIQPDTPEGRQLGLSARVQGHPSPIPGGRPHIKNAPSIRHTVPTPDSELEIGMGNAHGVQPGTHTNAERADAERGPNTVHATMPVPRHHPQHERPQPIPVFVVQDANNDVLRDSAPRWITVPASTAEPVRLCGIDPTRSEVMLLNESTSVDVRFAQRPADLNAGGGALLPWPSNSYTKIRTQGELYALSASASVTAKVSVIQIFERDM